MSLPNKEKIKIVIGPLLSVFSDVLEEQESQDILFLSPTISTTRLNTKDDNIIRYTIDLRGEKGDFVVEYDSEGNFIPVNIKEKK